MLIYDSEALPPGSSRIVVPPELAGPATGGSGLVLEIVFYGAGAFAFAALAAMLLVRARRTVPSGLFTVACALTAGWLGTAAYQFWRGGEPLTSAFALEAASGLGWLVFLGAQLMSVSDAFGRRRRTVPMVVAGLIVAASAAVVLAYASGIAGVTDDVFIAFRLLTIIAAAILLENLIRNTERGEWWSLKFLCIGLGGMLAYDLFLYADGLLFSALSRTLITARGAIYALVVPLLFVTTIRRRMWHEQLHVSHKTAFYSSALAAIGGYLAVMAVAAYYITRWGGTWGPVVQAIFLFGALVLLLLIVASGSSRAFLRVSVAKHLYRYKYDYREEWLRFTKRLAATESGSPIALRITEAMADIVDSTGGALFVRDGARYAVAATLYTTATSLSEHEAAPLARFLNETGWIIDLNEWRDNPARYEGLSLPPALRAQDRAWIIVPLAYRGELLAFVVLLRPRSPRVLDWEDFDFLKLIGLHAGSFLAEHRAMQALVEAHAFDRFNRRTAFVIHDIKNIVSELSLFASNIRKHGDKPQFREDLAAAMDGAVARSKRLIERLRDDRSEQVRDVSVRLKPLMTALVKSQTGGAVALQAEDGSDGFAVAADEDRLRALVGHLLQNAMDATGSTDGVTVSLSSTSAGDADGASGVNSRARAVIEVSDAGPGMDPEFVRNRLFKPFHSTKSSGLGIGTYQCREYARELGGDVEVITNPGSGTTMRVFLPLAEAFEESVQEQSTTA